MAYVIGPNGELVDVGRDYGAAELHKQSNRNLVLSNDLAKTFNNYGQQYQSLYGDQTQQIRDLDNVIAGKTPSVAVAQLQQGVGQIRQAQDSQAAGTSGVNAALARTNAQANTAAAQAQANQTGVLLRAKEIADARIAKAAALGQQVQGLNQIAGTTAGLESNTANTAVGAMEQPTANKAKKDQWGRDLATGIVDTAAGGLAKAALASDEDVKHNIKPADIKAALRQVDPITFEYDEGAGPKGERVGFKAQDLKGTKAGESIVMDGKPLKLDIKNLVGMNTAALADHQKVLDKIAKKLGIS